MCTSFTLQGKDFYFGRNLDLEYTFGEKVVITPRAWPLHFLHQPQQPEHYAMIGMASVVDGTPLYAEAANEKGLCMAGLYFPGNAWYDPEPKEGCDNVAPYELIPWLLGSCASLEEAKVRLEKLHLLGVPFREGLPLAPLHWMLADQTGCLVLEPMESGLRVYENPAGVLTNNPPFDFHLQNLNNYLNLTRDYPVNRFGGTSQLTPCGQGMGALGLPGDASPASRLVRTAFLRANSEAENQGEEAMVSQVFHILDAVAMVRGSVRTPEGRWDMTTYSCCINASRGIYYYKTYENNQLTAVSLERQDLDSGEIAVFELEKTQQIRWDN